MDYLTSSDFLFLTGTSLLKTLFLIFAVVLPMVSYTVYAERRVSALIQDRLGPNRTGFPLSLIPGIKNDWSPILGGLGQPVADAVKFLLKEDFVPAHVNKFYFWIAPALSMMPALVTLAAIPFGSTILNVPMVVANINVGLLFMFAISSVSVYGIVIAGWSSNSKYPFLGGIRSSSQMISYELGMGLSAVPVLLIAGSTSLPQIVEYQIQNGWLLMPYFNGHFGWAKTLLWIPATIWLFHQGHTGWSIFMLIWGIGVSSVDNVIKPWLISQGVSMPFILILFGVIGGALQFGLIGVFLVRGWATSDPASGQKPQWKAIGIAAISFVVTVLIIGFFWWHNR